jgi:hypothetical protein
MDGECVKISPKAHIPWGFVKDGEWQSRAENERDGGDGDRQTIVHLRSSRFTSVPEIHI